MPTSIGSSKKQEFQKNIYFCFIDYVKTFDSVDHNKLWKILQEMGIPDHRTCLLRNLYAGQEATVKTGHGTIDWFQIGKGVHKGYILSPCLFNLHAEFCFVLFFLQSCSVMSDSLRPHELEPIRLLCPQNSSGKNPGVGCLFLLQGIFPASGLNPDLLHCRQILYQLSHQGSPLQ